MLHALSMSATKAIVLGNGQAHRESIRGNDPSGQSNDGADIVVANSILNKSSIASIIDDQGDISPGATNETRRLLITTMRLPVISQF